MSCLKVCMWPTRTHNSLLLVCLHLFNLYFDFCFMLWVCLLFLIFLSLFCLEYWLKTHISHKKPQSHRYKAVHLHRVCCFPSFLHMCQLYFLSIFLYSKSKLYQCAWGLFAASHSHLKCLHGPFTVDSCSWSPEDERAVTFFQTSSSFAVIQRLLTHKTSSALPAIKTHGRSPRPINSGRSRLKCLLHWTGMMHSSTL